MPNIGVLLPTTHDMQTNHTHTTLKKILIRYYLEDKEGKSILLGFPFAILSLQCGNANTNRAFGTLPVMILDTGDGDF